MRVAVVEPLASGGMIHYAYQLCNAMAEQGVGITLVTSQGYELKDLPHQFEVKELLHLWPQHTSDPTQSLEEHALRRMLRNALRLLRRVSRGVRLVWEWVRLSNYLLDTTPDIVQFGKINFPFERFFLRWLSFRGLILTDICHEFELREQGDSHLGKLANRFYSRVFDDFDLIFLHAEENRQKFLDYTSIQCSRTQVIPLGNQQLFLELSNHDVDEKAIRDRYNLQADDSVVLFFGNLTYSKGVPDLVEAIAQISSTREAKLLIAGYPTKFMDLPALQRRISDLDLEERIVLDPRYIPMDEVAGLMKIACVVAFPYRNSSQSTSLQVAYSFGKPIIATRVGGLPEAVDDGKSGFLVEPGEIDALAKALEKLIDDPDLAEQMGLYAKHLSETRFSWKSIAEQVVNQYELLLQRQAIE